MQHQALATEKLVSDFVDPTKTQECHSSAISELVLRIHRKDLVLPSLIELLGSSLTSTDDLCRSRGTLLLSEVLARLPALPLDANAVHYLITFYCDRLRDEPCVPEVIKGLHSIVKHHRIPTAEDVRAIPARIFSEVIVQAHSQSTRRLILDIFELLFEQYSAALLELKSDFVFGFIQSIEGESDPRNLVVVFRLFQRVVEHIPEHERFAEELFDVVSRYFPITFTAKPGSDSQGITKDQLVRALRDCFGSGPILAAYCVPFLLDKLTSSVAATKLDALDTLVAVLPRYGRTAVLPLAERVWGALRTVLLAADAPAAAEHALSALLRATAADDQPSPLAAVIATECVRTAAATADTKPWERVVHAIAAASPPNAAAVVHTAVPLQLERAGPPSAPAGVGLLAAFAQAAVQHTWATLPHPLRPHVAALYGVFSLAAAEGPHRASGVEGLGALVCAHDSGGPVLADELVEAAAKLASIALLQQHPTPHDGDAGHRLRTASVRLLVALAGRHHPAVLSSCVPCLLAPLEAAVSSPSLASPTALRTGLYALAHICGAGPVLFAAVVSQLIRLCSALTNAALRSPHNALPTQVMTILLPVYQTLGAMALQRPSSSSDAADDELYEIATHMLSVWIGFVLSMGLEAIPAEFTAVVLGALQAILQVGTQSMHTRVWEWAVGVWVNGELPTRLDRCVAASTAALPASAGEQAVFSTGLPATFQGSVAGWTTLVNWLSGPALLSRGWETLSGVTHAFAAMLSSCPLSTNTLLLPLPSNTVESVAITGPTSRQSLAQMVAQALGSIFNKVPLADADPRLQSLIDETCTHGLCESWKPPTNNEQNNFPLYGVAWSAKGLLLRGHPMGSRLAEWLIDRLAVDPAIAGLLGILLEESPVALQKASHATVVPLYRQKLFTTYLPRLTSGYENTTNRSGYLAAIACMVPHLPKSVLHGELPRVLPLLVAAMSSLASPSSRAWLVPVLAILTGEVLSTTPTLLTPYLDRLIPLLLNLAKPPHRLAMRKQAVQSLTSLVQLPYSLLHPHRPQVLLQLQAVLDDKNRGVRKLAGKCANSWYQLPNPPQALHKE